MTRVHQRQHFGDPLLDLVLRHFFHRQAEGHVLEYIHVREQRVLLEYRIDAALIGRRMADVLSVEEDASLRRRLETRNEPKRRRLAAARRSQKRQKLVPPYGKIDMVKHRGSVVLIPFRQPLQPDDFLSLHPSAPFRCFYSFNPI